MSDAESNYSYPATPKAKKTPKGNKAKRNKPETPKSGKKDKPGVQLTAVECLLFYNIVRFNREPSNVDWDQVAINSNLKNASSAKVRFRQIQKKYNIEHTMGSASGGNRKRKVDNQASPLAAVDDDEDDDTAVSASAADTPSKPAPASRKKAAATTTGKGKRVKKEKSEQDEGAAEKATGSPGGPGIKAGPRFKLEESKDGEADAFTGDPVNQQQAYQLQMGTAGRFQDHSAHPPNQRQQPSMYQFNQPVGGGPSGPTASINPLQLQLSQGQQYAYAAMPQAYHGLMGGNYGPSPAQAQAQHQQGDGSADLFRSEVPVDFDSMVYFGDRSDNEHDVKTEE